MSARPDGARPDDQGDAAVQQFVEDFASSLIGSGFPRMPARVFSCVLISQEGRLTAAELSGRLRISPAAVSGAIQYLDTVKLVRRTREPGSRRDHYIVEPDVWYQVTAAEAQSLTRWIEQLDDGIALVGKGTGAGERLAETREFFSFLNDEMGHLLDRWAERKRLRSNAS
jgi:DNA-binding transcriptional regulator GbsR (MarR family)